MVEGSKKSRSLMQSLRMIKMEISFLQMVQLHPAKRTLMSFPVAILEKVETSFAGPLFSAASS